MKYGFLILFIFLNSLFKLSAQELKPIYLHEKIDNLDFSELASLLKDNYDISLYFMDEWTTGITFSCDNDSICLTDLLAETLEIRGINFFRRNDKQFFLTGPYKISNTKIPDIIVRNTIQDEIDRNLMEVYNNRFRFERSINKVVIGDPNNRSNLRMSNINGRVYSSITSEPVPGATIRIEGTNVGVISNGDGLYSLPTLTGTTARIEISCMGMEPETYLAEVYNSGEMNVAMREKMIDIEEVLVKAISEDNVSGMQMGFQRISMDDIKEMPTAFGERDILRVANMTAGVQFTGEGSAGINVRGSSSDQNLFLLNDIPILNTGHMFGFFSAFNPDMVSDFKLYKNNFPVEYGGRLSSVFDISTRTGNMSEFGLKGRLSPITGSVVIEGPVVKNKLSIIAGARSTYSDWILNRIEDPVIRNSNASFNDFMVGMNLVTKNNASYRIFGYLSRDKFTLYNTNDFEYGNIGSSLAYRKDLNENWNIKLVGVFSQYNNYHTNRYQPFSAYENEFTVRSSELKVNFNGRVATRHKTGIGGGVILYNLDQGSYDPLGFLSVLEPVEYGKESGIESSVHLFDEISLSDKLVFYAGLRFSYYANTGPNSIYSYEDGASKSEDTVTDTLIYSKGEKIFSSSGPEYRLALNYVINPELSIKFSVNRMRQYLFMLSNTISQSPIDRWKLSDPNITPPVSDQISIGLYKNNLSKSLETSIEFYAKKENNIVEYIDGADLTSTPNFETLILQGNNRAYGAELMIKKVSGGITGWASYTFSRSITTVNGDNEWEKINQGESYPSNYDKPHSIKLVGNIKFSRRVSAGTNLEYSTGRPITYPTELFFRDNFQIVNYSLRNEYRIPDYFRIDASINIEGSLRRDKLFHGSWSFSVYNLTGRRNAYSIYFKNNNGIIEGFRQSIFGVPIFTISYNLKLGNYASN